MASSRLRRTWLPLALLAATGGAGWTQNRVVDVPAIVAGAPVAPAPCLPAGPAALGPSLSLSPVATAVFAKPAGLRAFLRAGGLSAAEPVHGLTPSHAHALRAAVDSQLAAMRREVGADPELEKVELGARPLLDEIESHLVGGEIDPSVALRYSSLDPAAPIVDRPLRIGVYPVAADPFQWAHLLIGLQAIAKLKLDKVVFILAGDDPRKPSMTPASIRHPMGQAVLARFAPFFAFSPIADGTLHDGETNIFRLLALNPEQKIEAFYMVGDDHYKLVDKKGNPDTLPKLEANMGKFLVDSARHKILVAFNERDGHDEEVPTSLGVTFLPRMSFEASSTLVRNGKHALMPHAAYEHVRETGTGLYGIPPAKPKD